MVSPPKKIVIDSALLQNGTDGCHTATVRQQRRPSRSDSRTSDGINTVEAWRACSCGHYNLSFLPKWSSHQRSSSSLLAQR